MRIPMFAKQLITIKATAKVFAGYACAQDRHLSIEQLHDQALVLVLCYDSTGKIGGYGSGCLLWDYSETGSSKGHTYLLTATHILENTHSIELVIKTTNKGTVNYTKSPIPLTDSLGNHVYLTFTSGSGRTSDVALMKIEKHRRLTDAKVKVLARSNCAFSDSLFVGDRVVAFGFADMTTFDFVAAGEPLAISGIVAFKTGTSYVLDKKTHDGMSGGIVFKEYPSLGEFYYKAIGIVSADVSKYPDYAWITKLDYVDSILINLTGNKWGLKESP